MKRRSLGVVVTALLVAGSAMATGCDPTTGGVLPADTVLVRPDSSGATFGTITGYEWTGAAAFPAANHELPIYQSLDRNTDDFWNYLVDELLLSRVDVAMLHGRGCSDPNTGTGGAGNMCPRLLSRFVTAVDRAGARDVMKVGMWDDTGAYPHNAGVARLDLSNRDNWKYFWDNNIKIWFDTLPQDMWYLMDGKPVIAEWSLSDAFFSNQQGNASAMLTWIKSQFSARYGVEPSFILDDTWFQKDSTVGVAQAVGRDGWFHPVNDVASSITSILSYNGATWGMAAPGFRNGGSYPGCGVPCREVTRRDGATLNNALAAAQGTKFTLLEGWTDLAESAGYYRSASWRYPTQYINIVRRYADPKPATLRFQAEGADAFSDTTSANLGGQYANRALDVGKLSDGSGWYVGWTEPGEWLEYNEVELGAGTYRFTARAGATADGKRIHLEIDGVARPSVDVPKTGSPDSYYLVHLDEVALAAGPHNLRIVFDTGGVNLDWFFLKRN